MITAARADEPRPYCHTVLTQWMGYGMFTQSEADALIAMRKVFEQATTIMLPPGSDQSHELVGGDGRERFALDLSRSSLRLTKVKHQTRARQVVVLVRLDVDGAPHTNPDGRGWMGITSICTERTLKTNGRFRLTLRGSATFQISSKPLWSSVATAASRICLHSRGD